MEPGAESKNMVAVRRLYEARGNPDVTRQVLASDVRWEVVPGFPHSGAYQGLNGVSDFFTRLFGDFQNWHTEPAEIFEAGDHVVAIGTYSARAKATGKTFKARFAHVWTVRDGCDCPSATVCGHGATRKSAAPAFQRRTNIWLTNKKLSGESMQIDAILRRFEEPDETRTMTLGKYEVVRLGGLTIGRATYQPGWKWSVHVGPGVGLSRCPVEHIGLVLTGEATAAFEDGRVISLRAGDLFYIPPVPHDSWVVGNEPYVSLHFSGAEKYAKRD